MCATIEVDEIFRGIQTEHLWSLGRTNVRVVGTFKSTKSDGIDNWSFDGTFDFEPLFDGRGASAEFVNTAGWMAEKLGAFGTFDILFTGPVSVNESRYRNCDE